MVGFARRLADMRQEYREGKLKLDRVTAWVGHARHGHTVGLRRTLFRRYSFRQRRAV